MKVGGIVHGNCANKGPGSQPPPIQERKKVTEGNVIREPFLFLECVRVCACVFVHNGAEDKRERKKERRKLFLDIFPIKSEEGVWKATGGGWGKAHVQKTRGFCPSPSPPSLLLSSGRKVLSRHFIAQLGRKSPLSLPPTHISPEELLKICQRREKKKKKKRKFSGGGPGWY